MNHIIDAFTDQSQTAIFRGFDRFGKGILDHIGPSPLSFAHDDDADHSGLMQEGCDSCHMIHLARRYEGLKTKKEKRAYIKTMRQVMARFGDENQSASDEIFEILRRAEAAL